MDWAQLFLFELIVMRMTGFILFNPLLGRSNVPGLVKAGFILVLSVFVYGGAGGVTVTVPAGVLTFGLHLLLELAVGMVLGLVMRIFFMVVQFGGEIIDAQMGLTMAQIYDASSQINMSISASLLNILLVLDFFAENGHYTLLRLLLSSGELLPFGQVTLGTAVANHVVELFCTCILLAVKLALPIMAAELLGELGMGVLMKAIPQINAFVINIELKVIVGLVLFFVLLIPMNEFLLSVEADMLTALGRTLQVIGAGG